MARQSEAEVGQPSRLGGGWSGAEPGEEHRRNQKRAAHGVSAPGPGS